MKAVILAGGKSTRMYPLTLTKPKPMLKIANKPILTWTLDALQGIVDEVIIVVGYKKESIINEYGNKYNQIDISYVEQTEQLGSGHALQLVKDKVNDKFIVINGDDIYSKEDILKCIPHKYCVLAQKVSNPERFGVLGVVNDHIIQIIEKPRIFVSDLANTGLYVLNKEVFDISIEKSERGEYEIIDYIHNLIKTSKVNYEIVSGYWLAIGYPWDLLDANDILLKDIKNSKNGKVEKNVTIKGKIIVEAGSEILSGVYIEGNVIIGKKCKIGPNCYIRGSVSIGNNCRLGNACEVKNCIIGNDVAIGHLSYIGDSILGDNVNIGAGTITANLRHDDKNVRSLINQELVNTNRRKFGAVFGDDVNTGINTSIYPGRKLGFGATTLPGEIVKEDKEV